MVAKYFKLYYDLLWILNCAQNLVIEFLLLWFTMLTYQHKLQDSHGSFFQRQPIYQLKM